MSIARTDVLQLFANEFRDHLPIDAFRIRPLDDVVRNFHGKLHVESLTDASVGECLEIRDWLRFVALFDDDPAFPVAFALRSSHSHAGGRILANPPQRAVITWRQTRDTSLPSR